MKILAIGDICGTPGIDIIKKRLSVLMRECAPDLVIINGENALVRGISPEAANELFLAGADVITLGNHAFANRKISNYLDDHANILRPLNLPRMPGHGVTVLDVKGVSVCVANLIGRLNMDFNASSPFDAVGELFENTKADLFIIDFHAEATSEKKAFGFFCDGRASAVFGTHTHVQTADECILPHGCGYITDLGMTGGITSVIGVKYQQSIEFFRGHLAPWFESSAEDCRIQGALFTIGPNKTCTNVERINFK